MHPTFFLKALAILAISLPHQSEPNISDLASSSQFCAIGTVTGEAPVGRRLSPRELESLTDLGDTLGGTLFTMRIEERLCDASDTAPAANRPTEIHLFLKRADRDFQDENTPRRGERYLVFAQPEENQNDLVKLFRLDPTRVYYRVREGRVQWLGGQGAGVLSATRRYCEAVVRR